MQIDLTQLAAALISLIVTVISVYLIPYLKSKTNTDVQAEISYWVNVAVSAAEQRYTGTGKGQEKKAYVLEFLRSKGFEIDEDSLDNLIESSVLQLKKSLSD